MSVTSRELVKLFRRGNLSKMMAPRRKELWKNIFPSLQSVMKKVHFEVKEVPAHSIFMRFVPEATTYLKNYNDLFRLPPDNTGIGGYSTSNRFTGQTGNGKLGLNGSYWGTANGVAGEDTYYSLWKDYDGSGPPRLLAKHGHVVVQRIAGALNTWEDNDIPKQLLYSGSNATNIIVARTIRPIRCLNLDFSEQAVRTMMERCEPLFRQMLDALEFDTLEDAFEDSEFREFARDVVNIACQQARVEGIWVRTVRHELGERLHGFDKKGACNLILLGNGNDTLTDRLVGSGVIKIRSNASGLEVTAVPLRGGHSPYDDGVSRALTLWKPPVSKK